MSDSVVIERVRTVISVRADATSDRAALQTALVAVRQITSWAEAQKAALVKSLTAQVSFPEAAIAETDKCSLGAAGKTKERADTLDKTPNLAGLLSDGEITAGHIDAVTSGGKQLDNDAQRDELFSRLETLGAVAAAASVDEYRRRVAAEIRSLRSDNGETRLARQRRDTRLSWWTDNEGMWNLRGRFDPVTALPLAARLNAAIDTLFAESVPQGCPTDPIEKQKFLAAHALARLVDGSGSGVRPGRREVIAVIDADATNQPGPVVEWSIPVDIPTSVLADLCADPDVDVTAVVVRNGVIIHAPGQLDLGRSTRLANRAQRRALRGLYRSCAIPGCSVTYERCKLHHLIWWRNGGRTDLANLIPVCAQHHSNIHNDNWVITLGPNRQLSLRLPDGTIHNTGPPNRNAA